MHVPLPRFIRIHIHVWSQFSSFLCTKPATTPYLLSSCLLARCAILTSSSMHSTGFCFSAMRKVALSLCVSVIYKARLDWRRLYMDTWSPIPNHSPVHNKLRAASAPPHARSQSRVYWLFLIHHRIFDSVLYACEPLRTIQVCSLCTISVLFTVDEEVQFTLTSYELRTA